MEISFLKLSKPGGLGQHMIARVAANGMSVSRVGMVPEALHWSISVQIKLYGPTLELDGMADDLEPWFGFVVQICFH